MHVRRITGFAIASLALLVAFLHALAGRYSLYWQVWWFDIPMHFLGGVVIAGFVFWLFEFEVPVRLQRALPRFVVVATVSAFFYLLWEVFEYVADIYGAVDWAADTALDLAMDGAGFVVAYAGLSRYVR